MIYILSLTFFILQLLDWYTTSTILKNGGYEQNPIMSILFKYLDMNVVMCMKSIILPLLGYVIGTTPIVIQIKEIKVGIYTWVLNINFTIPEPTLLVALIILYIWVVIHNWKSL